MDYPIASVSLTRERFQSPSPGTASSSATTDCHRRGVLTRLRVDNADAPARDEFPGSVSIRMNLEHLARSDYSPLPVPSHFRATRLAIDLLGGHLPSMSRGR